MKSIKKEIDAVIVRGTFDYNTQKPIVELAVQNSEYAFTHLSEEQVQEVIEFLKEELKVARKRTKKELKQNKRDGELYGF